MQLKSTLYTEEQTLGSYLAGLWEGDGHISTSKNGLKPRLHVTFHIKELPLAEKLLAHLTKLCKTSVGSLTYQYDRNACVLNIWSREGLSLTVTMIQPWLRSPKAYQIEMIANWLVKNFEFRRPCFRKPKLTFNDAWLAGFTDADGSFGVEYNSAVGKKRLLCRWRLLQSMTYIKTKVVQPVKNQTASRSLSYAPLMNALAETFKARLTVRYKPHTTTLKRKGYYLLSVHSVLSKATLRTYYDHYHLLSSKRNDYRDWCIADDLMVRGEVYAEQTQLIMQLKNSMNRSRTHFDWSHLNDF